jgi:hypothetical protein
VFLDHFDALMSKLIFLKEIYIYYFDTSPSKKHFKKQPQPHFQTHLNLIFSMLLSPNTQKSSHKHYNPFLTSKHTLIIFKKIKFKFKYSIMFFKFQFLRQPKCKGIRTTIFIAKKKLNESFLSLQWSCLYLALGT